MSPSITTVIKYLFIYVCTICYLSYGENMAIAYDVMLSLVCMLYGQY